MVSLRRGIGIGAQRSGNAQQCIFLARHAARLAAESGPVSALSPIPAARAGCHDHVYARLEQRIDRSLGTQPRPTHARRATATRCARGTAADGHDPIRCDAREFNEEPRLSTTSGGVLRCNRDKARALSQSCPIHLRAFPVALGSTGLAATRR